MITTCWDKDRSKRLTAVQCLAVLQQLYCLNNNIRFDATVVLLENKSAAVLEMNAGNSDGECCLVERAIQLPTSDKIAFKVFHFLSRYGIFATVSVSGFASKNLSKNALRIVLISKTILEESTWGQKLAEIREGASVDRMLCILLDEESLSSSIIKDSIAGIQTINLTTYMNQRFDEQDCLRKQTILYSLLQPLQETVIRKRVKTIGRQMKSTKSANIGADSSAFNIDDIYGM